MSVVAMLLADARLPTGGHAYSAGMEPALTSGMPARDAHGLLVARARTTSLVEAGAAVVARHAAVTGGRLDDVEEAWAARTPSPALRDASRAQARGYLRLARRVWPDAVVFDDLPDRPCRAVVIGAVAAVAGLPATDLVRLAVYDDAATASAALLKLEPRDPVDTTRWILDACAAVEPRTASIAALTDPADIPAAGAPQSEAWAQAHARLTQRLFRA
ncbi:urease accessory protein UreF [Gordonia spumicola]|uniref:Urease accessory protein UreF n=1 Tax=Gordonia spumicola TaxID=589161 RepID=A0A7I9VFC4_9ACTN|nr:urease accessory UreF family protein [Gordonia spumicola]GEE04047.1 urease accessory protein UreF [Gordonia spumicola]